MSTDALQPSGGALSHLKVLDFSALVQGPMASQILADMGADVLKIERLDGEWSRHWGVANGRTHGETDSFLAFNRNKRSAAVDLKDEKVKQRILELAAEADVIIENFRPGVMARLGYGYDVIREINPRIIYASSSGWGQTGPFIKRPGQDFLAQAQAGILYQNGRESDPPIGSGVGIVDLYTGLHIVIAILSAVAYRAESGAGQRVDVNLFSCAVAMQQQELTYFMNHGGVPERPSRNQGSRFVTAPFGVYETQDGYVVIAMTPCPVLAKALDLPEIAQYTTNDQMIEFRELIYDTVAEKLRTGTTAHWIETMLEHDVWCGEVNDYEKLVESPQFKHNELVWNVPYGASGPQFPTIASPIQMSQTPPGVRLPVPMIGEHTDEFWSSTPWREAP